MTVSDFGSSPTGAARSSCVASGRAANVVDDVDDTTGHNVATKADVQAVRADLQTAETPLIGQIAAVHADPVLVEHRLMTRLGGLAVVLSGLLFAALRYWPPH